MHLGWHEPLHTDQSEPDSPPASAAPNWSAAPARPLPLTWFTSTTQVFLLCFPNFASNSTDLKENQCQNLSIGRDPGACNLVFSGHMNSLRTAPKRGGALRQLHSQAHGTALAPGRPLWMPSFPYQFYVQLFPARESYPSQFPSPPLWAITASLPRSHLIKYGISEVSSFLSVLSPSAIISGI